MPKLTKKEFAKLTGVAVQYVDTYLQRKKLVLHRGKLDTENELNQLFIVSRKGKGKAAKGSAASAGGQKTHLIELTRQKKEADLEKTRLEIAVLKIREERLRGEHLPTHLVEVIVTQLGHAYVHSNYHAAEQTLHEIGHLFSLPAEKLFPFKARLNDIMNEAVNRAVKAAKKAINEAVDEIQETREQGEHK